MSRSGSGLLRVRWAAFGAAMAVTIGGGALGVERSRGEAVPPQADRRRGAARSGAALRDVTRGPASLP